MKDNVTPISLKTPAQARLAVVIAKNELEENDGVETFVNIEIYSSAHGGSPMIMHNDATNERLLFMAEMLRTYALGQMQG